MLGLKSENHRCGCRGNPRELVPTLALLWRVEEGLDAGDDDGVSWPEARLPRNQIIRACDGRDGRALEPRSARTRHVRGLVQLVVGDDTTVEHERNRDDVRIVVRGVYRTP